MAAAGIRPGTEGANLIAEQWTREIGLSPTEESLLVQEVHQATARMSQGAMGDLMHLSIIPATTVRSLGSTSQGDSANLTFETATTTEIQVTPAASYTVVDFPFHMKSRLTPERWAATLAGYRKQGLAGLNAQQDTTGHNLATGFQNIVGGPGPLDTAAFLYAFGLLATTAKRLVNVNEDGSPRVVCIYHPSNIQHLNQGLMAQAYARGDNRGTKGIVVDAYKTRFKESGLVYTSGGVAYNIIFAPEAMAIGYNQDATVLPEETDGLVVLRLRMAQDYGIAEYFDECAVVHRSSLN